MTSLLSGEWTGLAPKFALSALGLAAGLAASVLTEFIYPFEHVLICISLIGACWIANHEKDVAFERRGSELYRFAEFGRLSAGIFHDLMNPLTAVSLAVEKLKEAADDPDPVAIDQIERAVRASKRMESLMHTARKQLRCDDYECVFPIWREVREAISLLEYKLRTSCIEIACDVPQEIEARGNPVRFFQIVTNLVSNAIDSYACARPDPLSPCLISVSARQAGGGIELSVKDCGCGIPRAMHASIFRPFFSTKLGCDGVGLGLSMTKHIVEKDFKGTISVESASGKGSVFTIALPLP